MSFKDEFLKLPPGKEREDLVYKAVISQGPPKMVPVTVPGPDGSKITYNVSSDYLNIDGIRVPMTGATAQRIANHFKMHLPTSKQERQIFDAADTKLPATPMSRWSNDSVVNIIQDRM